MTAALTDVAVTFGKPLDVLGLKGTSLDEIREYAEHLRQRAADLYAPGRPRRELEACPCCEAPAGGAAVELVVYSVPYRRCATCGHAFVSPQPAPEALNELYAEEEELSAAYTDRESLELRLEQVVRPKIEWTLEIYRRRYGRDPRTAIDVGAGGGHVVEGFRRAGVEAEGYELSRSARAFARDAFGIELRGGDFLTRPGTADLVTFFGLLEYTPEPRRFLEAARRANPGLLVVEVPRFDCLGTLVQRTWPETIARHLDPTSHVNCFSDASLAAALRSVGFEPVAAWYFGMDAYELAVQLALHIGLPLPALAEALLPLQEPLDAARLCDDLVLAAAPARFPSGGRT